MLWYMKICPGEQKKKQSDRVAHRSGIPTQMRRARKRAVIRLPHPNFVLALDSYNNRELLHKHKHKASLLLTHSFWPGAIPGTAYACPDYNQPAKTIWHTVYTESTFSRLGEIALLSNS